MQNLLSPSPSLSKFFINVLYNKLQTSIAIYAITLNLSMHYCNLQVLQSIIQHHYNQHTRSQQSTILMLQSTFYHHYYCNQHSIIIIIVHLFPLHHCCCHNHLAPIPMSLLQLSCHNQPTPIPTNTNGNK